jgi:RNA polymerase sigma factor (sigma-70 family)
MDLEHTYSIEQLVDGCRRGERKAQELLYRKLAAPMFNVCLRYASSDFEAEDMMQTGFIKVFKNISNFRGEGSFEGWIRRIMVNTAIEIYRKNLRMLKTTDITEIFDHEQQLFDMDSLETEDLMKLIQQLPDGYRIVFNMYAIEGYSHQEIANTLQISEGASKSQLSRARAWLRNKLIITEGGGNYGTYAG